jgi:PAS domain S-box-containing protein
LALRYLKDPQDSEAERQLQEWMEHYSKAYDYDQVRLLDTQGAPRLSAPAGRPPASAAVTNRVAEVLHSGRITIVDFYRHDNDQRIYLSILIPIQDVSAVKRAIGVLVLRIKPEKYLYPFILRLPTPSKTAETLLVRREGDDVLHLNELRFKKDAALTLRVPLKKTDIPAVKAVLGQTGIVEGVDYHGLPVIADVRPVPDSPWFLVVRMNTSEVYEKVRGLLWLIIGFMTALLFGSGSGLAFIWRQQRINFYKERKKAEEELKKSDAKYKSLITNMTEGFAFHEIITDEQNIPIDYKFVEINDAFEQITGLKREHVIGKKATEVLPGIEKDPTDWIGKYGKVALTGEELKIESYFSTFEKWFHVSAYSPNRGYFAVIFEDITERKKAEEQLQRSLKEKEVLLKEIHHRVKNNMQVIHSLLNLQASGIDDKTLRAKLEESRDRVNSMALIHEKLYLSADLAHIDFREYLKNLVDGIANTYKRDGIVISVDMEPVALDVNVGIPCGLIVNELVSNSLKYAFPECRKGTITVGIRINSKGDNVLFVDDNGIGFPADLDFRNTPSLGLQLVNGLTEQIHGKIELSQRAGTRLSITFPGISNNRGGENGQEADITDRR